MTIRNAEGAMLGLSAVAAAPTSTFGSCRCELVRALAVNIPIGDSGDVSRSGEDQLGNRQMCLRPCARVGFLISENILILAG